MLGITLGAAPGVPGGAIMAAVDLLQGMLGFDETAVALLIATYITIDSSGTATNVTGDGAIAVIEDLTARGTSRAERPVELGDHVGGVVPRPGLGHVHLPHAVAESEPLPPRPLREVLP